MNQDYALELFRTLLPEQQQKILDLLLRLHRDHPAHELELMIG